MTALEIVAKLKELPPVSQSALKLLSLLGNPELDNEEVVRALKYDNALTARLLRACNSSFYGFQESVASVDQAVLMLGYEKIIQIVLTLAFGGAMGVPVEAYQFEAEELWRHSLMTATAAEMLAGIDTFSGIDPSAAFTAGLLHDIGKLANHHQPVLEPFPQLSAAICLANSIVHLAASAPGSEGYAISLNSPLAQALELSQDKGEQLVVGVRDSLEKVEHFMALA